MQQLFNNIQLPNAANKTDWRKELSLTQVDQLADEVVKEYNNHKYRVWYCGVIYDFGPEQVHIWRRLASEGTEPAKLFSRYVKDARSKRDSSNER